MQEIFSAIILKIMAEKKRQGRGERGEEGGGGGGGRRGRGGEFLLHSVGKNCILAKPLIIVCSFL